MNVTKNVIRAITRYCGHARTRPATARLAIEHDSSGAVTALVAADGQALAALGSSTAALAEPPQYRAALLPESYQPLAAAAGSGATLAVAPPALVVRAAEGGAETRLPLVTDGIDWAQAWRSVVAIAPVVEADTGRPEEALLVERPAAYAIAPHLLRRLADLAMALYGGTARRPEGRVICHTPRDSLSVVRADLRLPDGRYAIAATMSMRSRLSGFPRFAAGAEAEDRRAA